MITSSASRSCRGLRGSSLTCLRVSLQPNHEQGREKALGGGVPADAIVVADVAKGQTPELDAAMQGAQALIIASSAVPQVSSGLPV